MGRGVEQPLYVRRVLRRRRPLDLENYKLILKVMTSSDVSEVLDVGRGVPEELEFQIQMEAADGTIRYNRAQPYQQKKFRILTQ